MKQALSAILVLPLIAGATAVSAQDADLEADITDLRNQYEERWAAGEAQALAELFTDDAVWLPPTGGTLEGRDEIQNGLQAEFDERGAPAEVEISSTSVERLDGVVLDAGTFSATFADEAGGEFRGEYVVLVEEADDGPRIRRLMGFPPREMPEGTE